MELHKRDSLFNYFLIEGLHNERNISLRMEGNVKILVGDNGSGKTTLLNCMYYIFNKRFEKLDTVKFERIIVGFSSGEVLTIRSNDISRLSFNTYGSFFKELERYLPRTRILELKKASTRMDFQSFQDYMVHRSYFNRLPFSPRALWNMLSESHSDDASSEIVERWSSIIDRNFDLKLLYLPTYRRVEEDLKLIADVNDIGEEYLINFGMSDVKKRFDRIRTELRESAVSLYTNLNGKMLTQLTSDYTATEDQFNKIKETGALKIVLDRVGDSISNDTKDRIIKLVEHDAINQEKYHPLVFVLSNLIDVYYEQKELDDSVKEFAAVANKYLVNKTFIYDESKVEIKIINDRTQSSVELDNLSSGEKQLVSILSKLYLENDSDYAILFDEPELSLSIEWQMQLLPDIINSGRCGYLLAATHSPFIFQNDLDVLTDSLCVDYVENIENRVSGDLFDE